MTEIFEAVAAVSAAAAAIVFAWRSFFEKKRQDDEFDLAKLREAAAVTVEEIKKLHAEGHLKTLGEALGQAPELIRTFRNLRALSPTQKIKGVGLVKAQLLKERVFEK